MLVSTSDVPHSHRPCAPTAEDTDEASDLLLAVLIDLSIASLCRVLRPGPA